MKNYEESDVSIRYRTAGPEDAPAIADLHARSWRATYRGSYRDEYLDGPLDEERRTAWAARLTDSPPNQFVVVAEDEGGIVGFACVYGGHDEEWGSFLDNIHADPLRHREGIGTGVFLRVVDWCREHYPEQGLHLKVLARNSNARSFYERLGGTNRDGTPPSSGWVVEGTEVRRYAWDTLDVMPERDDTTSHERPDNSSSE